MPTEISEPDFCQKVSHRDSYNKSFPSIRTVSNVICLLDYTLSVTLA